ncbi:hypothetical protein Acr_04g0000200 [Actinidia rufa]|uniref:Uncharacterized protein n=1 Tax=Actinidia rufa TaxID=165716 RepID=A0A7J0EFZ8_9ERIC|nr:hypothetical protein Acr_04g0000200 [Actinidia rufa]
MLKKLECSKQAYALDTLAWENITRFQPCNVGLGEARVHTQKTYPRRRHRRYDTQQIHTVRPFSDKGQGLWEVTARPPRGLSNAKEQRHGLSEVRRVTTKSVVLKSRPDLLMRGLSKVRQAAARLVRGPTRPNEDVEREGEAFGLLLQARFYIFWERVSVALLRKKRRFAFLGGSATPNARFLQLSY